MPTLGHVTNMFNAAALRLVAQSTILLNNSLILKCFHVGFSRSRFKMLGLFAPYFVPAATAPDTLVSSSVTFAEDENSNNYQVEDVLGTGTFSEVYRVRCKRKHCEYAMKAMAKSELNKAVFEKEVEAAKRLPYHPNIVPLKSHFEDEDKLYLLTECCTGTHILEYVAELHRKGSHESDIKKLFIQLAKYVH